jgi:FlaG/FlaF family flagellin (archaellin)
MMNKKHTNDSAVSPVVGVMLMLVVVIIIAAVVSGFAGSLVSGERKTPSASFETHIANTGLYMGSQFLMAVKGVSEPIPSKDLKLVTSWSTTCKPGSTMACTVGNPISGGNTSLPGKVNTDFSTYNYAAPIGFGPGVDKAGYYQMVDASQYFGNYTLSAGTLLRAYPVGPFTSQSCGANAGGYGPNTASYQYVNGVGCVGPFGPVSPTWVTGDIDSMQAVVGSGWENLRAGDQVSVKLIHIPSGKAIYDTQVAVEGPK